MKTTQQRLKTLVFFALALFMSVSVRAEEIKTEKYENTMAGVKMNYPAAWEILENKGPVVAFVSKREDAGDIFRENVNVIVQDLSKEPMSLNDYTTLTTNQVNQLMPESNILESVDATFAKLPGHKIVYTGKQGKFGLKFLQYWTIKDKKAYLITFTSAEDKYSKFLPEAMKVIDSFEIA